MFRMSDLLADVLRELPSIQSTLYAPIELIDMQIAELDDAPHPLEHPDNNIDEMPLARRHPACFKAIGMTAVELRMLRAFFPDQARIFEEHAVGAEKGSLLKLALADFTYAMEKMIAKERDEFDTPITFTMDLFRESLRRHFAALRLLESRKTYVLPPYLYFADVVPRIVRPVC